MTRTNTKFPVTARALLALSLVLQISFGAHAFAQNDRANPTASTTARSTTSQPGARLTVGEIMAEPSIAGMRPTAARVAPDGERVAFLWSAQGREPRDLYIVRTSGNVTPQLIVRGVDSPADATTSQTETRDEARSGERKEDRTTTRDAAQQSQSQQQARQEGQAQQGRSVAREQALSGVEWSPDSRRLLFSRAGDLFVIDVGANDASVVNKPRRITRTQTAEAGARWLADSRRILFQSNNNLFVIDTVEASLTQLTRFGAEQNRTANQTTNNAATASNTITTITASDDGALVAYVVSDTSKQRALVVPNYTGEFVRAPTFNRGWTEQRIEIVRTDGEQAAPTVVKLPAPEGASYIRGLRWTPAEQNLIVDRIDRDTKRRQLFFVRPGDKVDVVTKTGPLSFSGSVIVNDSVALINEETDAKWIASLSRIVEPAPQASQASAGGIRPVLFASERDGFNHLYLAESYRGDPGGFSVKQLTRGDWEVSWAAWLADGKRVVYSSTEGDTAERAFYTLDVATGARVKIKNIPRGMSTDPQLSKNGATLLFENSQWNVPNDLYGFQLGDQPNATDYETREARRLTDTVPARFKTYAWSRPAYFRFTSKDNKQIPARIYTPENFNRQGKYPLVVFVHGAGYLQNVINGWNNYYREQMFHTLLTQRGYVVLDIDYRGSAGYGRNFRTDVYDFLGGTDYQDHLDAIDYAVKNYAVDANRVGVYGGSYGGFMAEMLAMRAPEKIACAAALRPVADWKNYFASSPVYTTERLGFPDKNAAAYARSSPITYAKELRRPLLMLHGMVDDNVHFQDTVQLVQKLIELKKTEYFDVMFYPTENHAFTSAAAWTDEYERILELFETHLKK